jgi:acyl-CoA thioesterase FadM
VNYRAVARIGVQLRIDVNVLREEGRKRFLGGTLHDGSTLVADAEALYVAVKEVDAGADDSSTQIDQR